MVLSNLLVLHITAGALALIAGAAAYAFRKGSQPHRAAGNAFFLLMLTMATTGLIVTLGKPVATYSNSLAVAVTFYFVATSWMTVRRPEGRLGSFDYAALAAALAIAAVGVALGLQAPLREPGMEMQMPPAPFFVFAALAFLGAVGDARMIARGGISGRRRIARHLWRMGVAMFIAAGSFFLGQADEFPTAVREANIAFLPIIAVPVLAVLGLTTYWFMRVRFTNWWREPEGASAPLAVPVPLEPALPS